MNQRQMTPSTARAELPPGAGVVSVAITNASPASNGGSLAANDDSIPTGSNDPRNPLWIIAIGMAWFFGIAAAVMAVT